MPQEALSSYFVVFIFEYFKTCCYICSKAKVKAFGLDQSKQKLDSQALSL